MPNVMFRALLDLIMCSDPWPVPDMGEGTGEEFVLKLADSEARKRGYDNWVVAFHEHKPRWRVKS